MPHSFQLTLQRHPVRSIRDAEPPALNCLDLAASTPPGFTTVAVSFSPQANDSCDGPLTPVCVPPSGTAFAVGANSVTCTAFDRAGNTNTCSFNVTVTAMPAFVASSRLPDLKESAVAWGDFNNDGRLDLVIGGATRLFAPSRQAGIYLNNGAEEFNILPAGVPAVEHARVACADFDSDGRLDVLITGSDLSKSADLAGKETQV